MHYLIGAGREDYGASPKMVRVTCRHAMPGVGSMGSPEWCALCVRTECPPLRDRCEDGMTCARTADRSLYFLLLAVEWMLEPLLPREKTLATKT